MYYCLAVKDSRLSKTAGPHSKKRSFLPASSCVLYSCGPSGVRKLIPVAMRLGETPVPIPNTMVKTQAADDTILETVWESRWLPDQKNKR